MSKASGKFILVEHLTLRAWILDVWPYLRQYPVDKKRSDISVYYIEGSKLGVRLAAFMIGQENVRELKFRLLDVQDKNGRLIRLRLAFYDLFDVQSQILKDPVFQEFFQDLDPESPFATYFRKHVVAYGLTSSSVCRSVFLIHLANWKADQESGESERILFLNKVGWSKIIPNYAKQHGVQVFLLQSNLWDLKSFLRRHQRNRPRFRLRRIGRQCPVCGIFF